MTDKTQAPGDLKVAVSSDSVFLGISVPIEVRDSRHRLVSRTTSTKLQLPPGLYEVSAVLEDGRRHSAVADVVSGQQTPVTLVADEESTAESENAYVSSRAQQSSAPAPGAGGGTRPAAPSASPSGPSASGSSASGSSAVLDALASVSFGAIQQNRFTRRMYDNIEGDVPASEAAANVTFVGANGASLVRETRTLRIFQCAPQISEVPTATFAAGSRRLITSLPISPDGGSPSGSCAVRIEAVGKRVRAQAWITPQRTVANALQNMLASDYLLQAANVATSAIKLLRSKYDDPAGAALGALLLYKTGKLAEYESWVDNLASDFKWLPDGKILIARLHADRGKPARDLLNLCLEAAAQRPMYSECHSLLMDLLRRWPYGDKAEERAKALARLSAVAPFVDSGAICFSHWVPSAEEDL